MNAVHKRSMGCLGPTKPKARIGHVMTGSTAEAGSRQ
jgi:hypothetical protein